MTLRSMTGFAQAAGSLGDTRWQWEVRSVNGRGLDVRLSLPPGHEALELKAREAVTKQLARGNVSLNLTVSRESGTSEIRLNEAALQAVLKALARVRSSGDFDKPRPEGILAIKGVLEVSEGQDGEGAIAARNAAMLADLDAALKKLTEARAGEGARLATVLDAQITTIEALTARVAAAPARAPAQIKARLAEQLKRVMEAGPGLDEARLHQEAALIATRGDIAEELARLNAHVAAARDLVASTEPAGRKLDFLSQEFNREANTLCSKSNDVEITRVGLELKHTIDQMREQVQNIE